MEILKNQNKSLQKNVQQLTQINNESDRINASELAKHKMQKKLHDTMSKMKMQFSKANIMATGDSSSPSKFNMSGMTDKFSKVGKINLKEKMSGVSDKFGSMLGNKKS